MTLLWIGDAVLLLVVLPLVVYLLRGVLQAARDIVPTVQGIATTAEEAIEVLRRQTTELGGIGRINDSGVRILHAARAVRKAAVGR